MRIKIAKTGDLHMQYSCKNEPQPCFLELDCERRTLACVVSTIIGPGQSERSWNRLVVAWPIPALTPEAGDHLARRVRPLAREVIKGFSIVWDGHNQVGRFSESASEAIEKIGNLCEGSGDDERDVVHVWDADDWFRGAPIKVLPNATDDELTELAQTEEEFAAREGYRVDGIFEHLCARRAKAIEEAEEAE